MASIKLDICLQWRNKMYAIGIAVGLMIALGMSQLATPEFLPALIPSLMLLVVGGTTMMYVAGMVFFERDEGTLNAVIVSPLRTPEYLWSKILTLTGLATVESIVMIGGAMLIMSWSAPVNVPNIALLFLGVVSIGVLYTLIGLILVVRYRRVTDFLMPMAGVAVVLQLPFLYFLGLVEHPAMLLVPTSAPTLLMQGAYVELSVGYWIYGVSYTVVSLSLLTKWAFAAFDKHIVSKAG